MRDPEGQVLIPWVLPNMKKPPTTRPAYAGGSPKGVSKKIKTFAVSWVAWFEKVSRIRSKKPMIGSKANPRGAGKNRMGRCKKRVMANLFYPLKIRFAPFPPARGSAQSGHPEIIPKIFFENIRI